MKREHVISDELFDEACREIKMGGYWIAYNSYSYFLDRGDMFFFNKEEEARHFNVDNISDKDCFQVIHADSITSLLRQLPYGEILPVHVNQQELVELFNSFDWKDILYDPLHDTIEATTDAEKNDLQRMEKLLDGWENLYERNPEAALQLAVTYWEGQPMEIYKDQFLTIKNKIMNTENFEFLKTNVRHHGFGETLGPELEAKIKQGVTEFTLAFTTNVNKREMEATLYFKKSDKSDLYFFNKYDTRLKNEKDEVVAQTFYINNGWGVTFKEAYNLLNGRAVHKELTDKQDQKYQAWIQLDFGVKDKNGNYERKQFHQNYGFDLKEALRPFPIKEMMKEETMKDLIKSLEKGNVQQVTLDTPGKVTKVFIEANPQYKTVTVYNNKMQRLDHDKRQELMQKPEVAKDLANDKQKEKSLGKEEQVGKKQKIKGEEGLLPKKRSSENKKGLGV